MAQRVVFGGGDQLTFLKRLLLILGGLALVAWIGCSSITRVDAGHVGVRVKLAGDARGVQDSPTVQGWVFYNPLTEQIVQFPTSVQNVVWTQSAHEGKSTDESITFSSKEGASINADVGVAFHIDPQMAPKLYARFRQPDLSILADTFIRNEVREAFNAMASTLEVKDIYGAGKNKLLLDVTQRVKGVLNPEGIIIDQLTINGTLRLPENVVQSINKALEATQNAIQAENRVRQIKAEAEQAITSATGAAEAARQKATGEADAILIKAKAEAKANEIIRLSTSPAVLQYRQINRWDGHLPMYSAGTLPMLTIDASKVAELPEAERKKRLDEALGVTASETPANEKETPEEKPKEKPPAPKKP
jgi:regulator of protease activity HflC (stomatin/prohibitin superfamily)